MKATLRKRETPPAGVEADAGRRAAAQAPNSAMVEALRQGRPAQVLESLPGEERPVPADLGAAILARFSVPLPGLKVYEDEGLAELGQTAYARGNELHFAKGLYRPGSQQGRELFLHEAGHVVQQGAGLARGSGILESQALERQADAGFAAPEGFSMPAAASAPIQGGKKWDKFKSWGSKALSSIGGALNAGADWATQKAQGIRRSVLDSHHKAVDLYNARDENQERYYDQLSKWERFKWCVKNPLARLSAAGKQADTDARNEKRGQAGEIARTLVHGTEENPLTNQAIYSDASLESLQEMLDAANSEAPQDILAQADARQWSLGSAQLQEQQQRLYGSPQAGGTPEPAQAEPLPGAVPVEGEGALDDAALQSNAGPTSDVGPINDEGPIEEVGPQPDPALQPDATPQADAQPQLRGSLPQQVNFTDRELSGTTYLGYGGLGGAIGGVGVGLPATGLAKAAQEGEKLTNVDAGFGAASGILGTAGGIASMFSNTFSAVDGFAKGNRMEGFSKLLMAGSSGADMTSGLFKTAGYIQKAAGVGTKDLPILGIVSGGLKAGGGVLETIEGGRTVYNMKKRIKAMEQAEEEAKSRAAQGASEGGADRMQTERMVHQAAMLAKNPRRYKTLKQLKAMGKIRRAEGIYDITSGALNAAGNAMTLSGVAALAGTVVSGAGAAAGAIKTLHTGSMRKSLKTNTVDEELDLEAKIDKVLEETNKSGHKISRSDAKHSILEEMGFKSGKRKEAFNRITVTRALDLYSRAKANDPEATAILSEIGLSKVNGDYSIQGIAEKLGLPPGETWQTQLQHSMMGKSKNPFRKPWEET